MREILDRLENPYCGLYFDDEYGEAICAHCGECVGFYHDNNGVVLTRIFNHKENCLIPILRKYFERGPNS